MSSDARLHRLLLRGCNALWHTTDSVELTVSALQAAKHFYFTAVACNPCSRLPHRHSPDIVPVVQVCITSRYVNAAVVQPMSWVSALYRSSPAPVLSPSPGSPNTTLNGLWAALDSATGTILWETPSPLAGAMAVSPERDFIRLCEVQKVSCCLLLLQNPVGDSQSSCRRNGGKPERDVDHT